MRGLGRIQPYSGRIQLDNVGGVDRMHGPSYIGPTGPPVHPVGLVRLGVPDV